MKEFAEIENHKIEIWRRAYQRSLNLRVRAGGDIRVTCGKRVSRSEIAKFVRESRPFIEKRLLEIQRLRAQHPPKQYLNDETFLFFGKPVRLNLVWTWRPRICVQVLERDLEMLAPLSSSALERQKALHGFFRRQARLHLEERVNHFAQRMNLWPRSVTIRGQRTRWGSCSSQRDLSLNWKLMATPIEVIDYVVVHELAHLQHMNHSSRFWQLVETHFPNWPVARRWLKENEFAIAIQFQALGPNQAQR